MRRPAIRGILILLAVVLNLVPALRHDGRTAGIVPGFSIPASSPVASTTPFFREEFINPDSPLPMSHVASICELPGGRLAVTWYSGSREGARDVAIFFSTRGPGESVWSMPRAIVTRESAARDLNRSIKKVGNAVIFEDSTGLLELLYVSITIGGWSGSALNLTTSADQGLTWTPSRRLTLSPFFNFSELVKNAPAALGDGNWVVPIYDEFIGRFPELLWLRKSAGDFIVTKSRIAGGQLVFQPALVTLSSNTALVVLRDYGPPNKISIVRTADAGRTWTSPAALDLPNPNSGLDALRLTDGRLLLAFNDSTTGRENLRLAVSVDEGRTWMRVATLDEEGGSIFSYPFLIQGRDGCVHVVYTWKGKAIKHVEFSTGWLDERQREVAK
jgi:predicted neuraminidase